MTEDKRIAGVMVDAASAAGPMIVDPAEGRLIAAIASLVESNEALAVSVHALADAIACSVEDDDEPEVEPARYMNGSLIEP